MTDEQSKTVAPEDFWGGDILKRKEAAQYLEKYLTTRYALKKDEEGFVLAINAEWGYGKTFMLERWKKELSFKNYPAVYFDAWKNDFTTDPLIAFIAELDLGLAEYFKRVPIGKKLYASAFGKLKKIIKPASQVLVSAGAKHLVGMSVEKISEMFSDNDTDEISVDADEKEGIEKSFESTKKSLEQAVDNALKEHRNTKTAIKEFKEKLTLLIEALSDQPLVQLPVFIFIDELDRCRPNYAIELLEGIKHLFGVKGIYFVVATNIAQLSESVKAIYGAGFDGERYLKRFFDLEYLLPEPSSFVYAQHLLKNAIKPDSSKLIFGVQNIIDEVDSTDMLVFSFSKYSDYFQAGLRDQKQVLKIIEAAFVNLENGSADRGIHIHLLLFLTFLYQKSSVVYEQTIRTSVLGNPAFNDMNLVRNAGAFTYVSYSQGGRREERRTTIYEIAEFYLTTRATSSSEGFPSLANSSFPNNLISHLNFNQPGREFPWKLIINRYIDIVRHACGFVSEK
ncbi:KAP family P-loop NTPase fold protein [Undibacterium sp. Di27W]|uniref:KAP family P-loop NTPase fold protein n=1 Tax=Undibacterium sp. Di27W TaxID=3413036 RepID=UPI003BEFF18E